MSSAAGPIFHIEPRGGLAGRMFRYMVAVAFDAMVPGCRFSNVDLPEWGICHPALPDGPQGERVAADGAADLRDLARRASAGEIGGVSYAAYGMRMAHFLDVGRYRAIFRARSASPLRFAERDLVCPIGAPEVPEHLGAFFPLTPAAFYAELVALTGLAPVFVGLSAPEAYLAQLHAALPRARFVTTGDAMLDFAAIRTAKNIVVGVDLHAWLAAWLSHADRVFMTVSGLFNPLQCRLAELLPFGDPRYLFYLFPVNYAVPPQALASAHRRIAPFWRPVSHEALQRRVREPRHFDPTNDEILANFDAAYYLGADPELAKMLGPGNVEGARAHYLLLGIGEDRLPFRLSPLWYAARYPMAAFEVAQGDYSNFAHHYLAVGRERGYRPMPEPNEPWWD